MIEDDFDDDGYRWECQGCADKLGMCSSTYRENSNCNVKFCEYAKTLEEVQEENNG